MLREARAAALYAALCCLACIQVSASPSASTGAPVPTATPGSPLERLVEVRADDGATLVGKLSIPSGTERPRALVVFVNSSGPHTYDDRRSANGVDFRYHDLFAKEFASLGMAFFRYSTRGVETTELPPAYQAIDEERYASYLPSNEVSDLERVLSALEEDGALEGARVYLLGWSAGTVIAPIVAARGLERVDALLLAGYVNGTMQETLEWQNSGGSSMVFYNRYFGCDAKGYVEPADFEADRYGIRKYLSAGLAFESLDADGNGRIEAADFAARLAPYKRELLSAIERGDDAWLAANYPVRLTSAWFKEHYALPPNRETLLGLELPIRIFHGVHDQSCPVSGVRDVEARFAAAGKANLEAYTFAGHDHDLNYLEYPMRGTVPAGIRKIFEVADALAR